MVTLHIELSKQQISAVFDIDNTPRRTLQYTFAEFMQQPMNQILKDQLLYQKYYSRKVIDQGISEFHLPDLQPLPSIISSSNSASSSVPLSHAATQNSSPSTVNKFRLK